MKTHLFSLSVLLFFCIPVWGQTDSQNTISNSVLTGGSISGEKSSVQFSEQEGLILLQVMLDGKPHTFLFDTGAEISLISDNLFADATIIDTMLVQDNSGSSDSGRAYKVTQKDIKIGNFTFQNIAFLVKDLNAFREISCVPIEGIIGQNLIQLCNWMINPITGNVVLQLKPFRKERKEFQEYDLETYNTLPLAKLTFGGSQFWALLDSGFQGYLQLNDSLYFKNGKSHSLPLASGTGKNLLTINKTVNNQVALTIVDSLLLGATLFTDIPAFVNNSKPLLGAKFLKNFITIYNPKRKKLYLKRIANTPTENSEAMNEFGIKTLPDSNQTLVVSFLWKNSPAEIDGVRVGDKILLINGSPVGEFEQKSYCEIKELMNQSFTLQITIQHKNGQRKTLKLEKYDLFQKS